MYSRYVLLCNPGAERIMQQDRQNTACESVSRLDLSAAAQTDESEIHSINCDFLYSLPPPLQWLLARRQTKSTLYIDGYTQIKNDHLINDDIVTF